MKIASIDSNPSIDGNRQIEGEGERERRRSTKTRFSLQLYLRRVHMVLSFQLMEEYPMEALVLVDDRAILTDRFLRSF